MKTTNLTIRLDKSLDDLLTEVSRRLGESRSEVARDALRQKMTPYAEARGYLTDEDVFDEVS